MIAVLQRVASAKVEVDGAVTGDIGLGLLVLLGVAKGDSEADADYLVDRVLGMRIFDDTDGRMNISLPDIGGSLLVVSQFTLLADVTRGRRPSYDKAAEPALAEALYERFIATARQSGIVVQTGKFRAAMLVSLCNSGPVTVICQSAVNKVAGQMSDQPK